VLQEECVVGKFEAEGVWRQHHYWTQEEKGKFEPEGVWWWWWSLWQQRQHHYWAQKGW